MAVVPNVEDVLFDAMHEISKTKDIQLDIVVESFKEAVFKAALNVYKYEDIINVIVNIDKREFRVQVLKEAVEVVEDDFFDVDFETAKEYNPEVQLGEDVFVDVGIADFGRTAVHLTKQICIQKIIEAERESIFKTYSGRVGEIVTGNVQQITRKELLISLGKADAIMTITDQIRKERYRAGDIIKGYIYDVKEARSGAQICLSRTKPEFLHKLLELEIPEVYNGVVEIKSVARDPGNRAKIAVYAQDTKIDPVGACVGMKGSRIMTVVRELANEQIDVVLWSDDIETFVKRAIGKNINVVKLEKTTSGYRVVVGDDELAKAIGREGQNVRLSSQLTAHTLDVISEEQYSTMKQQRMDSLGKIFDGEDEDFEDFTMLPDTIQAALNSEELEIEDLTQLSEDELVDNYDLSMDDIQLVNKYLEERE